MKYFLILFLFTTSTTFAQSKASISALGAKLDTINVQTQLDELGLTVIFNISGIEKASTVSVGVGTLSLTADGISTIFDVVKDNRAYFLVQQNMRFKVESGTVTVFVHLDGKLADYQDKYAIVKITDKEGNTSEPQSVVLH